MDRPVKPNLLILGAMKASTTLLYDMLGQHPQIWFSPEKEPHYFTSPRYGMPGEYEAYLKLFSQCPAGKTYAGEASTGYTKAPHLGNTPRRIRETLGKPWMIYILRDPVRRTVSNFQHSFARGYYQKGYRLSQAIVDDPIIVGASLYARQLAEFEAEFGAGSVLVIIAEDLHAYPIRVLKEVECFLGLDSFDAWTIQGEATNSSTAVMQSVALEQLLGKSILTLGRKVGWLVPRQLKSAIVEMAPRRSAVPEATPVTPDDEDRVFNLVEEDLKLLYERLGHRIDCWPSVRRLRAAVAANDVPVSIRAANPVGSASVLRSGQ